MFIKDKRYSISVQDYFRTLNCDSRGISSNQIPKIKSQADLAQEIKNKNCLFPKNFALIKP